MSGYVDEKVARVSLDNKGFTKNVEDTINALNRLKKAFDTVNGKSAAQNIDSDMSTMLDTISKSTTKSEGLLSRLKGIFQKSTQGIDMSGAAQAVDKMNADVENRTSRTSDILSRLKGIFQKADNHEGFPNSIKSIDSLNNKIAVFDASPLAAAFEKAANSVSGSMTAMNVAVGNVLTGLIQKAMNFTGQFFRGPMDGLGEYKDKLGSIQTIMTNTEWEIPDSSVRMKSVSAALQNLNDYADKTVYSFADMTKNIGTFTAAGVSLDKSVSAIKGISNLAAASGSSTLQASTGMYQLSQALAAGRVGLQDWNSVVAAGMGGKLFQDALLKTAENMGVAVDKSKAFRETLKDGWLTSEVLIKTLNEFAENQSMLDAAQKVKTFGQLVDTVQESIGSGWATTWEYFLGGFEEARDMWTKIGEVVNPFFNDDQGTYEDAVTGMTLSLGNYRNALLKTWKDMGGQQSLFNSIQNSFEFVFGAMTKYREGFRSVIGDYKSNAQVFYDFTKGLEKFTEGLKNNTNFMTTMASVGKAVANVFVTIGWAIKTLSTGFNSIGQNSDKVILPIKNIADSISKFFEMLRANTNVHVGLIYMGKAIANVFAILASLFKIVTLVLREFFSAFSGGDGSGFKDFAIMLFKITEAIRKFVEGLEQGIQSVGLFKAIGHLIASVFTGIFAVISAVFGKILGLNNPFTGLASILQGAANGISKSGDFINKALTGLATKLGNAWDGIVNAFKSGYDGLKDAFVSFDMASIIKAIIGLFALDKWIAFKNSDSTIFNAIFDKVKGAFDKFTGDGKKMVEDAGGVLDTFKQNLNMFSQGVKVWLLLGIAGAVFLLAISIDKLSKIPMKDLSKGIIGMGAAMFGLMKSMKVLGAISKLPKGAIGTMIGFAIAIRLLAGAMMKLAQIPQDQLGPAIASLYGVMLGLVASMKLMDYVGGSKASVLKMIGMAIAVRILVMSVKAIADIDPERLVPAMVSLEALLFGLVGAARVLNNVKISIKAIQSLSVFAFATRVLVASVATLAKFDIEHLIPAVASVVILLASLATAARSLNGVKIKLSALATLITFAIAIRSLVNSVAILANYDIANLAVASGSVTVLLLSLAAATRVIADVKVKLSAMFALITFAGAIYLVVKAVEILANIPVMSLVKAMVGVEALLLSLIAASYIMQKAKPKIGAALGIAALGAAIYLIIRSIEPLANMSIGQIAKGILGMDAIMLSLILVSTLMNRVHLNLAAAGSLVILTGILFQVTMNLSILSKFSWSSLLAAATAMGGVMLAMAFTVKIITGSVDSLSDLVSLKYVFDSFGGVLYAIGTALEQVGKLSWQQMLVAVVGISAVMGALVGVTYFIKKIDLDLETLSGLAVFAGVLYAVGTALSQVAAQPWQGIAAATVAIGVTLGLLVGVSYLLEKYGSFGAAGQLILLAAGLMAIAVPIMLLSTLNLVAVGVAMLALAGNLAILLAAGALAQLVAPGLLILSETLITFGISSILAATSVLIAGVGFLAFVTAIKELAAIAPDALRAVVDGFTAFIQSISNNAPTIVTALVQTVKAAIAGLVELVPYLVIGLMNGIRDNAPQLVTSAVEMLTELSKGLVENLDILLQVAVEVAVQFVQSLANALLGIKDKLIPALSSLLQVVADVILGVIQNLAGPILTKIAEVLGPIMQMIVDFIVQLAPALEPIIKIIGDVLTVLIENLPGILQPIADTIKVLVDGIVAALEILAPVVETIVNGIVEIIKTLAPIVQSVADTIKAALEVLGQIFQTIGDVIKAAIQGIVDIVNSIGEIIKSVFSGIQGTLEALGGVFESVGAGIKTAMEGVGSVVESVGTAIKTALEGVGKVFESIGNAIKSALDGVANIIKAFGEAAKNAGEGFKLFGEGAKLLSEHGFGAAGGISAIAGAIAGLGGSAWAGNLQGFIQDIENLGNAINNLGGASGNLLILAGGMAQLQGSIGTISGTIPSVNSAFESLSGSLGTISGSIGPVASAFQQLATPIQQLQGSLTIVAGAFMLFTAQIGGVQALLDGIVNSFTNIQNGVTLVGTAIGSLPASFDLFNASLGNVQTTLTNFGTSLTDSATGFGKMGEAATLGMTAMNDAVLNGMVIVQGTMTTSIGQLAQAVTDGFILVQDATTNSMNTVRDVVSQNMDTVMGTIKARMTEVANQMSSSLDQVMRTVTDSMSRVSSTIQSNMSQINSNIQSSTSQIKGTFDQFASNAQNTITQMMSTINSSIQNGMNTAKSTVDSNMNSIMSTISSYNGTAKSNGYNVGWYISDGIASGIWANVGSIESAAQRIINKANEAARAAAQIHSPSRLFAKSVGKYIPQGIAMGIDKEMPKSIQQMQDTFKNGFTAAADDAVKHGNAMAEAVAGAVNQVGDMLDVAVDDMNYTPTITPVIDASNLDKFKPKDYGLNLGSATRVPTPVYSPGSSTGQTTTVNTDNSTKEYNINVSVDNGGHPINPKELAKQVQEHMKQFDDENRRGRGEEVLW
jgi:tape measure domain|uniref:Tail tape measure n=1 Tax=Siphoviridae sp. ctWKa2 TaxID=2825537 RepID=A0A8S5PDV6_9CAUD|nr:MAG TPA: tail tape measure [Siphoviridae sp. ctWKa2]